MEAKMISLYFFTIIYFSVLNVGIQGENFRQVTFSKLQVWMKGCDIATGSSPYNTALLCSAKCVENNCSAYRFNSSTKVCTICGDSAATDLKFDGEEAYFPRLHRILDVSVLYEYTTEPFSITVDDFRVPGKILYFSQTFLTFGKFEFQFNTKDNDTIFAFSPHLDNVENSTELLVRGTNLQPITEPFPFDVGKKTEVHVLVTPDEYRIYYDSLFCFSFDIRGMSEAIEQLAISGDIHLDELII